MLPVSIYENRLNDEESIDSAEVEEVSGVRRNPKFHTRNASTKHRNEFYKHVKEILTGANGAPSRNRDEPKTCTNKSGIQAAFFQTQRICLSPENKVGTYLKKVRMIRNFQAVKTYLGDAVYKNSNAKRDSSNRKGMESVLSIEKSKEDEQQQKTIFLCGGNVKVPKLHIRTRTIEGGLKTETSDKGSFFKKKGEGESGFSGSSIRLAQFAATPRHIKIVRMRDQVSAKAVGKMPGQRSRPQIVTEISNMAAIHNIKHAMSGKNQKQRYELVYKCLYSRHATKPRDLNIAIYNN